MLIVFIGPPGAGKGTQAKRVVEFLKVPHLSTGEMLRQAKQAGTELGKIAGPLMDRGELVPDPLVVQILGERMQRPDCAQGCLLDGFPRTLGQARSLDSYLEDRDSRIDLVIELHVDDSILENRLINRSLELASPRPEDRPEAIPRRIELYHSTTEPLLNYYRDKGLLRTVDGIGTVDEVFDRIRQTLIAAK